MLFLNIFIECKYIMLDNELARGNTYVYRVYIKILFPF